MHLGRYIQTGQTEAQIRITEGSQSAHTTAMSQFGDKKTKNQW